MKRILSLFIILYLFPYLVYSQITGCPDISVENDTTSCQIECVDLVATYLATGETTQYVVDSIAYAPPFPFTGGTAVFVGEDDIFSEIIPIPFDFCFYGNIYTSLVVGANGVITFDTSLASPPGCVPFVSCSVCNYAFTTTIPSAPLIDAPYENAIHGAYLDIDPSVGGDVNYTVLGSAPCRTFIVNFNNVPSFSCNTLLVTQQIVIYETTNAIEVYIDDKPTCSTWNSGNAVIGIQNIGATQGLCPPNRNTGAWSASQEAWRFTPDGIPNYFVEWFDLLGNSLGFGDTLNVCTQTQEDFKAEITYTNCNGTSITEDAISTVYFETNSQSVLSPTSLECVAESNDSIYFDWIHPAGADTTTLYQIMGSTSVNGPYFNIASVSYPSSMYSHAISLLPSGTNFYYLTPAAECVFSLTSDTLSPVLFVITSSDVDCWDDTDGSISVYVDDYINVLSYEFYLDGILNTNPHPLDTIFTNVNAGIHYLMVVDTSSSCAIPVPVSITAPGYPLQALVSGDMNLCYGGSSGVAIGSGSGGTAGYSYTWSNTLSSVVGSGDTISGLIPGSYYLGVTDANGCDTSTSFQIVAPQVALTGSPQMFGVVCKGDSTGMLVGDAQGSWAPYQYYWFSSGDTLQGDGTFINSRDTLFDLPAGLYELHIYDREGCFISYTITVAEPAIELSIDSMVIIESIACYGDSVGRARLYASGGMPNGGPNYTYLWDNGETGIIANGLTSGYRSVILSDEWGCEVLDSIYMPENTEIESQISTFQDVSCYGYSDGSVWITSVGGSPSYLYFWSNGHIGSSMPDTANGLIDGSYYVTTRDILGCEVVDSIIVTEPDPLSMEAAELDWIDCYGDASGLAYAAAVGGTTPYTFVWDNGQWIGDTINSLTLGLHTVVVTDARGCIAQDTVFTHEPTKLVIAIDTAQTVLPYCDQLYINTASLSAVASGGTVGYTYVWNDNPIQPQTTATASALTPYNYYVLDSIYTITVTDSKGCTASVSTDTLQTFSSTMDANVTGSNVSCYGLSDGDAMVTAFGAFAPYTYDWTGPSICPNTSSVDNLLSGLYSVLVTDSNNCTVNRSISITQPDYIYFTTLGATNEVCLGACNGQIHIEISGGSVPYTGIAVNNSTGNTITSLMSNDSIMPGICSGNYTLIMTDANDCVSSVISGGVSQQTVGSDLSVMANIDLTSINNIDCYGMATGSLQVLNPNTSTGYSYSWENINNLGTSISTTTQAVNLIAGTYVLYAYYGDSLGQNYTGCTVTDMASVTQLPVLEASASITDVDCYGKNTGQINVGITGGSAPYNLQWNPGGLTGSIINNLISGTYTLTITDVNNCQVLDSFSVAQPQQALSGSISESNYLLTASAIGGTTPFSYSWREQSNSAVQLGSNSTYTATTYGSYYVVITDANGCLLSSNVIMFTPTWDCVSGVCVDPQDDSGDYSSLSACNAVCVAETWDCIAGVCIDQGTGQGVYATESSCIASCIGNTGLDELSELDISIYPNPFRDETAIDFGMDVELATIVVVDIYGKQIEQYALSDVREYILKRNNKASGVYFVEIEISGKQKRIFKIIIE